MRVWLCLGLMGCVAAVDDGAGDTDGADDTDVAVQQPTFVFRFAVLADPHVTSEGEHADRLRAAMAWIEAQRDDRSIELVLVLGDVAWSNGLSVAAGILGSTTLPVVPIIGDNEVHGGSEEAYDATFADHYADLGARLPGFARAPTPVWNEPLAQDSWFQNFAFDHHGVRFIGLDWASRVDDPLVGEFADLNEVDGGTWDWFTDQLGELGTGRSERAVLLTHNPMLYLPGGLFAGDQDRVTALLEPWSDVVAAAYGGHLHLDMADRAPEPAGYEVFVTDATWDDEVRVRLVEVWDDGRTLSYVQELVTVPFG